MLFLYAQSNLISFESCIYITGIAIILYAILFYSGGRMDGGLLIFFAIKSILAYLLTFLGMFLWDDYTLWFRDFVIPVNSQMITSAILYLIPMLTSMGLGLIVGSSLIAKKVLITKNLDLTMKGVSINKLYILSTLIFILNILGYYIYGVGRYVDGGFDEVTKLLNALIYPPITIWLMTSAILVVHSCGGIKNWRMNLFITCTFILCMTLTGSKGGVYFVFLLLLIANLAIFGDPLIYKIDKKITGLLILLVPVLFLSFQMAYYIKWVTRTYSMDGNNQSISIDFLVNEIKNKEDDSDKNFIITSPIRRLSLLEQAVTVNYINVDNKLVNLENMFKSAFDRVVPGIYFDVPITERLYPIYARGLSLDQQLYEVMENAEWSLFGLFTVYFGSFYGELSIFILSALISYGYKALICTSSPVTIIYACLYIYAFDFLYSGFGVDSLFGEFIPYSIQIFLYYKLIKNITV